MNHAVISPELIREVEARMNRDYLPPSLKMQHHNSVGGGPQSPPVPMAPTTAAVPATCQMPIAVSHQSSLSAANNNAIVMRRFGRACKLPTVQEVGELFYFDFIIFFVLCSFVFTCVNDGRLVCFNTFDVEDEGGGAA